MLKEQALYITNSNARKADFIHPKPNLSVCDFELLAHVLLQNSDSPHLLFVLGGDTTFASVLTAIARFKQDNPDNNQTYVVIPCPCGSQNNAARIAGTYKLFPKKPTPESIQKIAENFSNSLPPLVTVQILAVGNQQGNQIAVAGWYIDLSPDNLPPLSYLIEKEIDRARQSYGRNDAARIFAIARGFFKWVKGATPLIRGGGNQQRELTLQHTITAYPFSAYGRIIFSTGNQELCHHTTFFIPQGMDPREALLRMSSELALSQILGYIPHNFQTIKSQPFTSPQELEGRYNLHTDSLLYTTVLDPTINPTRIPGLFMPIAR